MVSRYCLVFALLYLSSAFDAEILSTKEPIFTVSPNFLSVNIDGGQFIGTFWYKNVTIDLSDPKLTNLSKLLAPGYLRIGGTDNDRIFYNISGKTQELPVGYTHSISADTWKSICQFSENTGLKVVFGLNGGPGPRGHKFDAPWNETNAKELLQYTLDIGCQDNIYGWELGNEPNMYFATFGAEGYVTAQRLVNDYQVAREMINKMHPTWKLLGIDQIEMIPILDDLIPTVQNFCKEGGLKHVDAITYHWYPFVSDRCVPSELPIDVSPERLANVEAMDKNVKTQENFINMVGASGKEIWMGETAGAACGGQINSTDAWASSLWWIDTLAQYATYNTSVVCRQCITGSDYALLDFSNDNNPNPDYFSSMIWKHTMGSDVLKIDIVKNTQSNLRAYAHCSAQALQVSNSVTVLLINVDAKEDVNISFPQKQFGKDRLEWILTADSLEAREFYLNNKLVEFGLNYNINLDPVKTTNTGDFKLAPRSIAFISFSNTNVEACSNQGFKY